MKIYEIIKSNKVLASMIGISLDFYQSYKLYKIAKKELEKLLKIPAISISMMNPMIIIAYKKNIRQKVDDFDNSIISFIDDKTWDQVIKIY